VEGDRTCALFCNLLQRVQVLRQDPGADRSRWQGLRRHVFFVRSTRRFRLPLPTACPWVQRCKLTGEFAGTGVGRLRPFSASYGGTAAASSGPSSELARQGAPVFFHDVGRSTSPLRNRIGRLADSTMGGERFDAAALAARLFRARLSSARAGPGASAHQDPDRDRFVARRRACGCWRRRRAAGAGRRRAWPSPAFTAGTICRCRSGVDRYRGAPRRADSSTMAWFARRRRKMKPSTCSKRVAAPRPSGLALHPHFKVAKAGPMLACQRIASSRVASSTHSIPPPQPLPPRAPSAQRRRRPPLSWSPSSDRPVVGCALHPIGLLYSNGRLRRTGGYQVLAHRGSERSSVAVTRRSSCSAKGVRLGAGNSAEQPEPRLPTKCGQSKPPGSRPAFWISRPALRTGASIRYVPGQIAAFSGLDRFLCRAR